jgi:hypothetical protein
VSELALLAAIAAAIGLSRLRTTLAPARLAAWVLVLAFGTTIVVPPASRFVDVAARGSRAELRGGDRWHNAAIAAAAAAGPRADDLELAWTSELAVGAAQRPLGARALLPEAAVPIDPRRVQVQVLGTAAVDRPVVLAIAVPGLDTRSPRS